MGIIVSKNARDARRLEPSGFPDEAYMQDYITRNPTVLPFDELDGGDQIIAAVAAALPGRTGLPDRHDD